MHCVTRKEEQDELDPSVSRHNTDPLAAALGSMEKHLYPRRELSALLKDYNQKIGNDEAALANAERVVNEMSYCIVTGQQLGFLGGPAYTILKAVSCLLIARQTGAIPLFWLATEDHDIAEIEKTYTLDSLGNLKKYKLSFPKGLSVEDLRLSAKNIALIEAFFLQNRLGEIPCPIRENDSYCTVMATILARLFRGTGLLFLEPKLLRPMSQALYSREIKKAEEINALLRRDAHAMTLEGKEAPLSIQEGALNLFLKDDHLQRIKLIKQGPLFFAGKNAYSEDQLLELLAQSPHRFSSNAAARPLVQCHLIPTAAYVAGPNELKYHRQLKGYFAYHNVPMPSIIPRLSMTFIPKKAQSYLEILNLAPWEAIPTSWESLFLWLSDYKQGGGDWERAAREQCEKLGIPYNALHYLRNLLRPYGERQERTLNWFWLQAQTEENLIEFLLKQMSWNSQGHHYCFLS